MISLRGVCKRFDDQVAVSPLSLEIPAGHTTVLIGPSGSGKSTLLRMVVGLVTPDAGSVHIDGELLDAASAPGLRRRMGYVIQDGGLFPHLDARHDAGLMARHLGWSASRIAERQAQLAELVRLPAPLLERYPAQLSGGQRQRVALLRALMLDPEVLLLDEPLAALDPMIRSELQDDLAAIFRKLGKTVLLVTHDLGEAAALGDQLVLLSDGAIVQQGTPLDLLEHPADDFVRRFVRAQRSPADRARERAGASTTGERP